MRLLRARQEQRRRQLIERLNQKEGLLVGWERLSRRTQMTEEELEAEIERERNDSRNQFGLGGVGA
jgi:hypothetical protein